MPVSCGALCRGWGREQRGKAEEEKVTTGRLLQKSWETTCNPVHSRGKYRREYWKCWLLMGEVGFARKLEARLWFWVN